MKRHPSPTTLLSAISCLGIALTTQALAVLPEPDHTIYGTAQVDGVVASTGTVSLQVDGETLASYPLGADPSLGPCDPSPCLFALRVPMDFGEAADPRPPGKARPGDEAAILIDGVLAGVVDIGDPGVAQLLDVDTSFLPRVPGLSVVDAAGAEAAAGPFGLELAVTLRLSFAIDDPVTVEWQTADGTAHAGTDYGQASGVAVFAAGETVTTVTVTLFDDAAPEADPARQLPGEVFHVVLSNPSEAILLDAVGTITIVDDDTPPALRVSSLSVVEPPTGAVDAAFTVSLSHAWEADVSFDYAAMPGTAGAGDFELEPGSATIPAGGLSVEVPVRVLADSDVEGDETFRLELSNPVAATVRSGTGHGVILENPRLLTWVESQHDGVGGAEGLLGAIDLALSPDGAHLYAAGRGEDALSVYVREPGTGRLGFVAAYRDGEGGLESLDGVEAVSVSPDGGRVYAASFDADALSVFERDPASGRLALLEVERESHRDLETGDQVAGLDGAIALLAVAAAGGGDHVYVAGSEGDSLSVFRRHPASGLVSFEQALKDGVDGTDGLGRVVALAIAPDGLQVYAAAYDDRSVAVFERDPATGRLTFAELYADGVGGVDGLDGAAAVAVSADGASVYGAGQLDGAVTVFDRDPSDGRLTFREAHFDGFGTSGLMLATDVAVSRDGSYVYATGFGHDALVVFARAADGSLTPVEVERDDTGGVDGLDGATALAVSADDVQVYATGTLDAAVAVFRRDLQAPAPPAVFTSTSHQVGVYSSSAVIEMEWAGAEDEDGGSGIAGYRLVFDGAPDTIPGPGDGQSIPHGLDPHSAAGDPQPQGERWAHLLTCDHAGSCSVAHAGPYRIDTTEPVGMLAASVSHQPAVWSREPLIEVEWSGATDDNGVAGYSYLLDEAPATVPDTVLEQAHGTDPHSAISTELADGDSYYFHLRSCDTPGNCTEPIHLGPFWIETVPPSAVTGLASTSHTTDDTSTLQVIDVVWDTSSDAASGVSGYAVEFDQNPDWDCDEALDVAADVTEASSPELEDGVWYAHVCAGDEAGNWTAATSSGPYAISTAPAVVTFVTTVADTGDGVLAAGEVTEIPVTQLYVDFSRPMNDPAGDGSPVDVTNPESWRLIADGGDGQVDTVGCGGVDPADAAVVIERVGYTETLRRASLWLEGAGSLAAGSYRLIGCAAGLHDELDGPLDGDGDGAGGDDFLLDFAVGASNRLLNPNFDLDLGGWLTLGSQAGEVTHDGDDADQLLTSGSALMAGNGIGGQLEMALAQCLPVLDVDVALRGRYRLDGDGPEVPAVVVQAEYFQGSGCNGPAGERLAAELAAAPTNGWTSFEIRGKSPAGATSVLVSVAVLGSDVIGAFEARFDVLYFGHVSVIFSDGFETGDTTAWSQ